jgi:hypothetical protein
MNKLQPYMLEVCRVTHGRSPAVGETCDDPVSIQNTKWVVAGLFVASPVRVRNMAIKFRLYIYYRPARVAQSVWCLTTDWTTRRSRFEDFPSILCVQTGSGVHPASCLMGTGSPFSGGKARPRRDANNVTPSTAEVLN